MARRILFLSALDFKEKSIQVIRKTPEAYVRAGWQVDYIVARDNLRNGNYFYEREINLDGVNIKRLYWPFPRLRAVLPRPFVLLLGKLASFVVVAKLAFYGWSQLKRENYDVVYGYELQGVLAMNMLKSWFSSYTKSVSRFQGVWNLQQHILNKRYLRLLFNADWLLALRLPSNMTIMTNDGTQGDKVLFKLRGDCSSLRFWANGVEEIHSKYSEDEKDKNLFPETVFISISRLVEGKRIDRALHVMAELKRKGLQNFVFLVVGEGNARSNLENLVTQLELTKEVEFVGGVNHQQVFAYLEKAYFFISMYDASNVGNPLLEAIRANKIIITLNNGDTGDWIKHKVNGLIYDPKTEFYEKSAEDILEIIEDKEKANNIIENIKLTEKQRLWTWDERLAVEVAEVEKLCG